MIDLEAATQFVDARYGGRAEAVEEIGRGEWSTAYGFRLDGVDLVVRFGAEREDFEKDRIAAGFASPDLPIPRVLDIGTALGGHYAISERAFGAYLDALDERGMRATLPSLFAALDATRAADVSRYAGFGMWGAAGHAPHVTREDALLSVADDTPGDRTHGWRDRMASSRAGIRWFDDACRVLRSLVVATPAERHLLHGDPLNRNILVQEGRITAVIDWGCGTYGDFVYDLAHLTFSPIWFPAWRDIDFAGEAEQHYAAIGLDVPRFRERLRCYELHIGLAACAYVAFRGRWDELELLKQRTLQIAGMTA